MVKADLSDDYANAAYIEGAEHLPDIWEKDASEYRSLEHAIGRARLNLAYGADDRQALDLFLPSGRATGLALFIHGGYWMQCDRRDFSHFSHGFTQAGWAVALPSYRLAPAVRISEITADITEALIRAATLAPGPIVVAGHSAGGHLALRMNCADVSLPSDVEGRLAQIIAISPVADLRPLLQTSMNGTLRLDAAEAKNESPSLAQKRRRIPTLACVGSEERPAFLDQARGLAEAWPEAELHIAPGRNHFDILDLIADAHSPLLQALPRT